MQFELRTAGHIVFGMGEHRRAPQAVLRYGRRVFLVTGSRSLERAGILDRWLETFHSADATTVRWIVSGEPETHLVDEGTRICREAQCDVVLAIGGGSVIDAAKAVAALVTNGGQAMDYLEAVGQGREITRPPLPLIAVPTTAGSGSEVTRNSVLRVPELSVKRSMRSDLLLPRVAIVDPSLASTAPRSVAASSGLDALTHLIESYVSRGAQPTTDALAIRGIGMAFRALRMLADGVATAPDWEAMSLASLWGGICLANAGLGAVHGLVAPLGGLCRVAHGAGCGCLLPATFTTNVRALRARAPRNPALVRYEEIARIIVTDGDPTPERAAAALDALRHDLGVPTLHAQGVTRDQFAAIIAGSRAGSMRYNPIELTDAELEGILIDALGPDAPSA